MAIVFFDGFDLYNATSEIARRGWTGTPPWGSFITGRFGGRAVTITGSNNVAGSQAVTSGNTFSVGVAVRVQNLASYGNGSDFLQFRNGTTVIARVGISSSGHLRIGRGDYTTNLIVGSAAGLIVASTWYYIEVEFTRNGSTGIATLYINGTQVATASSANTGASAIDNIAITSGGTDEKNFDDMYINDTATRSGESRVEVCRPSADSSVQWTPNSGANNYSRVSTTLYDDDTTYVSSATPGHTDLLDMGNLSSAPQTIRAVQTHLLARKDDATTREIRTKMKNGGTTTNGTTRALGASYVAYVDIYETNPDDAAAFVDADISAMQIGYEVVT
jgi:hypothetical protein